MKKVALSEDKKKKTSLWGAKQKVLEQELKEVKRKERDEGLNLSDDEGDEDIDLTKEKKVATKKAKEATRKFRRDDETANVFWNLRSKRNN